MPSPELYRRVDQGSQEIEPSLKTAIIYAGQAQDLNLLRGSSIELRKHRAARRVFNIFDEVLHDQYPDEYPEGFNRSILENGSPDDIRENGQLIVVQHNLACTRVLQHQREFPPRSKIAVVGGQSLGFLNGAEFAGAIDTANLAVLVKERKDAMLAAYRENPTTLAFFAANYADERIEQLREEHDLQTSMITSESFMVLGGPIDNVNASVEDARGKKITARSLNTDGAFHTTHMQQAADLLAEKLEDIEIKDPSITLLANTNAQPIHTSDQLRTEIINQIPNTVLWLDATNSMIDKNGVEQFIEVGNDGLLTNHIQRDLEKQTGKGRIVKRLLVVAGITAATIGTTLVIRHALKDS